MKQRRKATVYYHLPGLFEFHELYCEFLPLFREHREYFYDWCGIGSVYGAPACLLYTSKGNPLLLFINSWSIGMTLDRNEGLKLAEFSKN